MDQNKDINQVRFILRKKIYRLSEKEEELDLKIESLKSKLDTFQSFIKIPTIGGFVVSAVNIVPMVMTFLGSSALVLLYALGASADAGPKLQEINMDIQNNGVLLQQMFQKMSFVPPLLVGVTSFGLGKVGTYVLEEAIHGYGRRRTEARVKQMEAEDLKTMLNEIQQGSSDFRLIFIRNLLEKVDLSKLSKEKKVKFFEALYRYYKTAKFYENDLTDFDGLKKAAKKLYGELLKIDPIFYTMDFSDNYLEAFSEQRPRLH